jgi:all-trans-retinol 13,14-reductase
MPKFLSTDDDASKAELPCFMSFPSAKDAGYNSRCPGKSTVVVLTESRVEYFGNPGPQGKRGDAYEQVKRRYKEALLNTFYLRFPHLKQKVTYVDVGTPWSNDHYIGHPSSYGLDQDVARFLDPTLCVAPSGVRGLYLTGQDFLSCGVFAQPIIAFFTLARVLGYSSLDFWLLAGELVLTVLRRSVFARGPTHPTGRELCQWVTG